MRATDVIIKKRGKQPLTREEISFMVAGYTDGTIPDYQMSALLMATFLNGMTFEETGFLTDAMLTSGNTIDLRAMQVPGLHGPFVDKHSTGGVGDKISLPLAPIVAACGVQVPMMSGRALGHTGGTLDKLESIAGYNVRLEPQEFARLIAKTGYAMTGQTERIAPADRKMYALRDVTGTVESIPLITASILSKKAAEGSDALVFDVKFGRGAFMKDLGNAQELASYLVNTSRALGKQAVALLTAMDAPLGRKTGNFLEIEETLECLGAMPGAVPPQDVMELTYSLGAHMLVLGDKARTLDEGRALCEQAVRSGRALERFLQNVADQGGDPDALLKQAGSRRSPHKAVLVAKADGYLDVDAYKAGLACITLGVGRTKSTDSVCPDAGFVLLQAPGSQVSAGQPLMEVYAKDAASLADGTRELEAAVSYPQQVPPYATAPLIAKEVR